MTQTGEAEDLTRTALDELGGQLSSGELRRLVPTLPEWLHNMPNLHNPSAPPGKART